MKRAVFLFVLLAPLPFFLPHLNAQNLPVVSYVFRSTEPLPVSVNKFILPPLLDLDASVRVSVSGDLIKVGLSRPASEGVVRQAINGTGMLTVETLATAAVNTGEHGVAQLASSQAPTTKDQWVALHPHLYPNDTGTPAQVLPWIGLTDPTEIAAVKQAWMQAHALVCPLAPSPRCMGTTGDHE